MTREEILQKIRRILAEEFEINESAIRPEARLYEDLELDSIDAVDLLVQMKAFIPGKIDPGVFKKARTVDDLVEVLYPLVQ
jgi:acyl carrier protein